MSPLLEVEDLRVDLAERRGSTRTVLDGLSFSLETGEGLALTGGSIPARTAACLALVGLTNSPGGHIHGRVAFDGQDLLSLRPAQLRRIRGDQIGFVPCPSPKSLHPLISVGAQVMEAVRVHRQVSKPAAHARAIDLLELVGVPAPHRAVFALPHELAALDQRRVSIAIAVANRPRLLIAEEPVAGLPDSDHEAVLDLLSGLRRRHEPAAMLVSTQDQPVANRLADRVLPLSQRA